MKRELFDPPAIVQPAEEAYGAMMKRAGLLNSEIISNDRLNIRKALEIGRLLERARPLAKDDWEQTLESVGISRQRASDYRWGAGRPPEEQAEWGSTTDLRRARAEQSTPAGSDMPQLGQGAPAASTTPERKLCRACRVSGSPKPKCKECAAVNGEQPPVKAGKLCPACKAAGQYKMGCDDCKVLNGGKRTTPAENAKAREEHGPGADDGEKDAEADKYDEERLKHISAPLFRECKKIARTHGLKCGKTWSELDPKLMPVAKAIWKARDVLKDILHKLEAEGPRAPEGIPE